MMVEIRKITQTFLVVCLRLSLLLFSITLLGVLSGFFLETTYGISCHNKASVRVGAYYFDGWSGLTQGHLTASLVDSFPEREPKWGWITSTPATVKAQIDVAADAGLSFFSFCWYFPASMKQFEKEPLNRALAFYLKAPNQNRIQFCLLVANHQGYTIGPANWKDATREWIKLFKNPSYVKVNNKPLLTFFSLGSLIKQFGSPQAVRQAFDSLRTVVNQEGLPGVSLAACVYPDSNALSQAQACGFDILTGYNYHGAGVKPKEVETPIDSLIAGSSRIWNRFQNVPLLYIPVVTLNWDARPWATPRNGYANGVRYIGFSSQSVYRSVRAVRRWINDHPDKTPKERIALVYAWNEYGEGAWLTPSRDNKENLLDGVKKALSE